MNLNVNKTVLFLSWAAIVTILFTQQLNAQVLPAPYTHSTSVNSIFSWDVKRPLAIASAVTANTNPAEVMQTNQFIDGLGRPLQTVVEKASPLNKDIVTPLIYDSMGRQALQFLPFTSTSNDGSFKINPFQQQKTFDSAYFLNQGQTYFYGITKFEASPLSRVLESYAPGNSWAGSMNAPAESNRHGVDTRYGANTANDSVQMWTVTNNTPGTFGSYSIAGPYAPGQLSKLIVEDEHGGEVIEFKDKQGKVVLKKVLLTAQRDMGGGQGHSGFMNTYYIYDDVDNLRCVLQPVGMTTISRVPGWQLNNVTVLNEQCFRYEYDGRGRMILKKLPGAGKVEMVYDRRNRLVLSRDSSLTAQGYWLVNKYDVLNRVKQIGLLASTFPRLRHQDSCDNNLGYPAFIGDVMQENYYDNYSWINCTTPPAGISCTMMTVDIPSTYFIATVNQAPFYAQSLNPDYTNVKGKQTGMRVRILGTATFLHSVNFYDSVGRVIQTRGANISLNGGYDVTTTQYDFSGKVLRVLHRQEKGAPVARFTREATRYVYDHAGRLDSIIKKVGSAGIERVIAANDYDEMGQLKTKKLGANLETQTFEYNIRGWLLGVNRASLTKTSPPTSKFSYELAYDNVNPRVSPGSYGTPSFRGDISGMLWRSIGDGQNRKYNFAYDPAHRLLKADFTQFSNTNNVYDISAGIDYSVVMGNGIHADSAYDVNGNIRRMTQKGFKVNSSTLIDDLRYTYLPNSNKLLKVVDGVNDPLSKMGDFKEPASSGDDYAYDLNANLKSDNNKGISSILYTHLNMPYEIRIPGKGKIVYAYDNLGNKLKKEVYDSTGTQPKKTTWLYMQNFVYKNDSIEFFTHEEGRARYDTSEGSVAEPKKFEFDYFLKDHLGNVRMVLTEEKDSIFYDPLTFENANQVKQDMIWENKTGASIDINTSRITLPASFNASGTNGTFAMLVRKSTGAIGAAKLLKVMSGDRIHTQVDYFYNVANANNTGASGINSLIATLASAIVGSGQVSGALKDGASSLTSALSGDASFVNLLNTPNVTTGGNNAPKAYLNILFFDEQFKPDNAATLVVPVGSNYTPGQRGVISKLYADALVARQNGYVYVYFSNESNEMVYFDNFMLTHELSSLREESHYYPFGLTMAGISSKAIGKTENRKKFNGIEHTTDLDMNQYDAFYRTMDPQTGRFWQIDPEADILLSYSPYEAMGNNPISNIDPLGDFSTRFSAWWHRLWHGGGSIKKNEFGEWYVNKYHTSTSADGNPVVTGTRYYGKGRNQYSTAGEEWKARQEQQEVEDEWVRKGIYYRTPSREEANENNLKLFAGALMPNVLKGGTAVVNVKKVNILSMRSDIILNGGRSGEMVKTLIGPANSVVKGSQGRIFITDDAGRVIWDITKDRAKSVIPGQGFGPKVKPTEEQLIFLNQVWN